MAEEPVHTRQRLCRHLRSKGMYVYGDLDPDQLAAESADTSTDHDGYFWCLRTMSCLGPDKKELGRSECGPDRDCYEPV